ncbi:hypothetical protein JTB14_012982 [Gonioctena quinquepunctata]|nr:hypothetical protein JTB14_012982 [Gonioctena quinquepunctata]
MYNRAFERVQVKIENNSEFDEPIREEILKVEPTETEPFLESCLEQNQYDPFKPKLDSTCIASVNTNCGNYFQEYKQEEYTNYCDVPCANESKTELSFCHSSTNHLDDIQDGFAQGVTVKEECAYDLLKDDMETPETKDNIIYEDIKPDICGNESELNSIFSGPTFETIDFGAGLQPDIEIDHKKTHTEDDNDVDGVIKTELD